MGIPGSLNLEASRPSSDIPTRVGLPRSGAHELKGSKGAMFQANSLRKVTEIMLFQLF